MIDLPEKIKFAVNDISKLPGVGKKSALRQVMSILKWNSSSIENFSKSISNLRSIQYCKQCNLFCDDELCSICANPLREEKILCVVESITDLMAIENSGEFYW